jgi:hypothetical protein
MAVLLILPFLFGNFVQKWIIPDGKNSYGRVVVDDVDHDGLTDVIVRRNQEIKVMFYELNLQNQWQLQDSIVDDGDHLLWAYGDFDLDGFSDIAFQKTFGMPNVGIAIYESSDSFSYPTQEVWRDTVGPPLVLPISAFDIDRDGLPELVKNRATPYGYIGIYESIGDNHYELIFADNPDTSGLEAPAATHAFGDFDEDGMIECVFAGGNEWYWIYESPADNTYAKVTEGQLSTFNIRDCLAVPDADGDGKPEFVVKGFIVPTARIHAFIFEAISDNTYEIIKSFDLPGGHNSYYGGYSDVGDLDDDGIAEIAIEACQTIYVIKSAGNDSFYIWETLPGNNSGSSVRVYDIDGNGLSEVIISGNNETRIYEYQVGITELVNTDIQHVRFELSPNPFRDKLRIVLKGPERHEVELEIYDVGGRLVKQYRRLNSTQQNQIYWDGRDARGHNLPGGVYFLKLKAGNYGVTEKLLLIR